jgi:hypothetical protein
MEAEVGEEVDANPQLAHLSNGHSPAPSPPSPGKKLGAKRRSSTIMRLGAKLSWTLLTEQYTNEELDVVRDAKLCLGEGHKSVQWVPLLQDMYPELELDGYGEAVTRLRGLGKDKVSAPLTHIACCIVCFEVH